MEKEITPEQLAAAEASVAQTPMDHVRIDIVGNRSIGGQPVIQEMTLKIPRGLKGYEAQVALNAWAAVAVQGGLATEESGNYRLYPNHLFDSYALKFHPVVGVSLA